MALIDIILEMTAIYICLNVYPCEERSLRGSFTNLFTEFHTRLRMNESKMTPKWNEITMNRIYLDRYLCNLRGGKKRFW